MTEHDFYNLISPSGGMADAVDSKSTAGNGVGVQVPSRAPNQYNPNQSRQIIPVGDEFGLLFYFDYNYLPNTATSLYKEN